MNKITIILIAVCWLIFSSEIALCQPDTLWTVQYDMRIRTSAALHDGSYAIYGSLFRNEPYISKIMRIDSVGNIIWEDTWELTYSYDEMIETPDSGIAMIGRSYGDSTNIKKYDMDGDMLYSWSISTDENLNYGGFIADEEGGYIAAGEIFTSEDTRWDVFLIKISSEGEIVWNRVWEEWYNNSCYDVKPLPDDGFMILSSIYLRGSQFDINVIRTDEEGETIWQNNYGSELLDIEANDSGRDMIATNDGNFIIVGKSVSRPNQFDTLKDIIMTKIDIEGNVIWFKLIDQGQWEYALSIAKTVDGGYVLSGFDSDGDGFDGNPFIMKTDYRGNLIWWDIQLEVSLGSQTNFNVVAHEDRTFSLILGQTPEWLDWLLKYGRDPNGVSEGNITILPNYSGLVSAYPNPFNSIATLVFSMGQPAVVEIDIFNALGRRQVELVSGRYQAGLHSVSWDGGGLPSGDYIARMTVVNHSTVVNHRSVVNHSTAGGRVTSRKVTMIK